MNITERHNLPAVEKLKIIEALWGDLVGDESHLTSLSWHETELKETEENFLAGSSKFWTGNKPRKNCVRSSNENPSSPFSHGWPRGSSEIL